MSAIGGMVNFKKESMDTQPLFEMSRAMILRGRTHRGAYLHGNVALVQNLSLADKNKSPLPRTILQDGNSYTFLTDGNPKLSLSENMDCGPLYELLDEEDLPLAYLSLHTELADVLRGNFALAVADEHRGELYLARDAEGSRPLFYLIDDETLFFASEIKALLRIFPSSARVDLGRLRTHLLSPYGVFRAEDLYRDIQAIPAGHSAVWSRLGLRIFRNHAVFATTSPVSAQEAPPPALYLPTENELASMLAELLYAFDYPQFDYLMPSLLHELSKRRAQGLPQEFFFQDPSLCMDLLYAQERADRIGALRGCLLTPLPPNKFFAKERDLRRLERVLRSLLASTDTQPLRYLFGKDWSDQVTREKNTAKRIRMLGLLYQTLLWAKNSPLLFS